MKCYQIRLLGMHGGKKSVGLASLGSVELG